MALNPITIKRLAKDVKYLIKNPLNSENIYYKHDENNLLKGYAMIIGNKNTPYENGYYFFKFDFPDDYPFNPPKVTYLTNDGIMRFNPNLYINGKVCLSILNTWNGEGWSSCQNIHSICLILSSILNENPLLNEPGIRTNNDNINSYNLLLKYKNLEFSIIKQIEYLNNLTMVNNIDNSSNSSLEKDKDDYFNIIFLFKQEIINTFKKNKISINNNLEEIEDKIKNINEIYIRVYDLKQKIDFNKIKKKFLLLKLNEI
tara:strand:- start:99 stop:872 length:774 start_codon:yes stop_codon:yes gene_type:complete